MFGRSEKIYNAYEKPEAAEVTERMALVREGFSFWAFSLHVLWLLMNRLWLLFGLYILTVVVLSMLCEALGLSQFSTLCVQLWLQLMLGFHAYDLQGWLLKRRGYRFAGVIVAADDIAAERRYYEFAS